jgi:uncharacterized membrane protein YdbT with pleckstrin-like domain
VELLDGEEILWSGRPTWRAMLSFYLKWGILALLVGAVAQVLSTLAGLDFQTRWFWAVSGVLLVIALLVAWIKRLDTRYTITNRRLHVREGIFSKHQFSTHIERVQNANTAQSLIDRMLNVGDVDFDTAGTEDKDFRFPRISDPGEVVRLVADLHRPPEREGAGV